MIHPGVIARRRISDEGMILPLVLVYVMIGLTLIVVIVDVTAVHLQRNRLYGLADAAALNAANAIDPQAFYDQGGLVLVGRRRPIPLTDRSVQRSVRAYLERSAAGADLQYVAVRAPTGSPVPGTAEVTLSARARLPMFGVAVQRWWSGVPIGATVRAESRDPSG